MATRCSIYQVIFDKMAFGVSQEAPFKLRMVEPKAPIAQSGAMTLKVIAERKPEFKAADQRSPCFTRPLELGSGAALP